MVQGCGRRFDQREFRRMEEVSFPVLVRPANAKEEKTPLLTGKRETAYNVIRRRLLTQK